MDLKDIRTEIDLIDSEIISLLKKRMDKSHLVAEYKKENNLPVLNTKREEEILDKIKNELDYPYNEYVVGIYKEIFKESRALQEALLKEK